MLSLWYRWEPGHGSSSDAGAEEGTESTGDGDRDGDSPALRCATSRDADVVRYLEADDGVAFEVSTNEPPYRGVRGNGTATIAPDAEKRLLRSLLERYLGGTDSALARRLLDPEREEVEIRVEPARVHSWDYAGRMRDATGSGGGGGDEGRGGRT
jgi:hypothetical protein